VLDPPIEVLKVSSVFCKEKSAAILDAGREKGARNVKVASKNLRVNFRNLALSFLQELEKFCLLAVPVFLLRKFCSNIKFPGKGELEDTHSCNIRLRRFERWTE